MKKVVIYLSLFFYFLFSQFVFGAVATTNTDILGDDDFCMTKKLDSYQAKHDRREATNIAECSVLQDVSTYILDGLASHSYIHDTAYALLTHSDQAVWYYPHAPPDPRTEKEHAPFISTYIGITLQLL